MIAAFIVVAALMSGSPGTVIATSDRKPFPDVSVPDLNGKPARELPRLQAVVARHPRVHGVAVSVDAGSAVGAVRATEKRLKLQPTWSVLHDKDGSALLGRVMPGASVPVVVVLDAQGRVAFRHEGYHPGDDVTVEQVVVALLAEPR